MEISDRRYQELLESIGNRHAGREPVRRTAPTPAPSIATGSGDQQADFPKTPASVTGAVKEILLVDPEVGRLRAARSALSLVADVVACSDFRAARAQLLSRAPDLLVTNLRLQAYNGLHLVHLTEGTHTRCVVYGTYDDRVLAQEVQAAGAFYEHSMRLPRALASYVNAALPAHDRRDPGRLDRRRALRGGRRCTEREL
jgi:hypothetical protein